MRRPLIIALAVSILIATTFALLWRRAESHARRTEKWTRFVMDSLGTTVNFPGVPVDPWGRDSVYWQWVATTAQLQSRRWQGAVAHWRGMSQTLLTEFEVDALRREGLADPTKQLRDSLNAHAELIPYLGVRDGAMHFGEIVLLPRPLVYAEYDDGHADGCMLLEYDIEPGAKIEWRRLWWRLN